MPTVQNHNEILQWWDYVVKNEGVHHAYLVVGAYKDATHALIRACVERLGIQVNETFTSHPDVLYVTSREEEGEEKKKNISVEEVRGIKTRLQGFSSALNGWRVVIVECIEDVSGSAANALLKSLEEPGVKTVFFLITASTERVLPTIKSRCHTVYTIPPQEWHARIIENALKKDVTACQDFLKGTTTEQWGLVQELFAKEKNWPFTRVQDVLTLWSVVVYKEWRMALQSMDNQKAQSMRRIADTLLESFSYAHANVQTRLIFEHLVTHQTH